MATKIDISKALILSVSGTQSASDLQNHFAGRTVVSSGDVILTGTATDSAVYLDGHSEEKQFIVYDEPKLDDPVVGAERNTFRKGKRKGKKFWLEPGGGK